MTPMRHGPRRSSYTQVLVEEWDGYVWRRIFGNGPVAGRDVAGVVVTDAVPGAFTGLALVGAAPIGTAAFSGIT